MRVQILCLMAIAAVACDDHEFTATPQDAEGVDVPLAEDGSFEPDGMSAEPDGAPRHEWYIAEGPGGPVIQIPIAFPRIGGLFVHTREMSNAEARRLGADIPTDAVDALPVVVDYPTAAAIANAASMADGLEPCYAMPIGDNPSLRLCDGWRLAGFSEWAELVDDARAAEVEWRGAEPGDICAEALDVRNVCYKCTCPDGPRPVGLSVPNRFGLQDIVGNEAEMVIGGGVVGGRWSDGWPLIKRGDPFEDPMGRFSIPGALRLVSLPNL